MIRTLIEKELREHWLPLAGTAAASLVGLMFIVLSSIVRDDQGSALASLRAFLIMFVTISGLVLCNRLVVREYQGKTQLFLEGLPLTRIRVFFVKYVLGLAVLFGIVALVLALLVLTASRREFISLRFLQIIAARSFTFTWGTYSFFFAMGLLGRYRVTIYLLLGVGLTMIDSMTDLELRHFGPIALVDERLAFERDHFPVNAIVMTLALAGCFTVTALLLALVREGSVAALLSERMSHRERVFVSALVLGLIFLGSLYESKRVKKPFDLSEAVVEESDWASVKLLVSTESEEERGRRVAERVHHEIEELVQYLHMTWSPPIFVTTRRDLDANRYDLGVLKESDGLLVGINLSAADFNEDRFIAWLVREFLIVSSRGRVKLEPRMWVLDGFGPFWVRRDRAGGKLIDDRVLALRAAYGTTGGFSDRERMEWLSFRERVGDDIASGVAWSGLNVLSRLRGAEGCRSFLQSILGRTVPNDARGWWSDRGRPIEREIERCAGVRWPEFVAAWTAELAVTATELESELAKLPRITGAVTFEPISPDSRVVKYRVSIEPPPTAGDSRVAFLYAELGAFDAEVDPHDWRREEFDFAVDTAGDLPGSLGRGGRFFSTFALDVEELGCAVISGWARQEVR